VAKKELDIRSIERELKRMKTDVETKKQVTLVKNVNLKLLLVVIILMVALVGFNYYYMEKYQELKNQLEKINDRYEFRLKEAQNLASDLQRTSEDVETKSEVLEATKEREMELSGRYNEMEAELGEAMKQLTDCLSQNVLKEAEAEEAVLDMEYYKTESTKWQSSYEAEKDRYSAMKSLKESLDMDLTQAESRIGELEDCLSDNNISVGAC